MNEQRVNVAELIAPSFDGIFFDVQEHRYTHYWLAGGRGSTKSSLDNFPYGYRFRKKYDTASP